MTAAFTVTRSNAAGEEFTFEVSFDPNHPGLIAAMSRAKDKASGRGTAANGAVVVRLVSRRQKTA